MSKLEELLQGVDVKWLSVDEIFNVKNGYTPSKSKEEYWNEGTIPWFRMEDIRKNGRLLNNALQNVSELALKGKLIPANSLIMSTTATLGEHALVQIPFLTNQQITSFSLKDLYVDNINTKYLFYCFFDFGKWCKKNANQNGGLGIIGLSKLKKYKFPIPCSDNPEKSLEIQQEIVRVLDELTTLTNQLTTELESERQNRKKQFEFFREQLLSFEKGNVEWKELKDIFYLKNGYTPSKSKEEYWTNGTIPWFRMEDIRKNGRVLNKAIQNVNISAIKGGKLFPANSLIVATSATIGEHALVTVPYLSNQRFTNLSLKEDYTLKYNVEFLNYYCFILDEWCKNNTTIGNFAGVDMTKFKKFLFPIPPLAEQERIVKLLDQFDATHTAIEEEITKEIKLRTQQYEYYREKLLSFPQN